MLCCSMYMYIVCPSISNLVLKSLCVPRNLTVNRDADPSGHNLSEFHGPNCVWLHVKLGNQSWQLSYAPHVYDDYNYDVMLHAVLYMYLYIILCYAFLWLLHRRGIMPAAEGAEWVYIWRDSAPGPAWLRAQGEECASVKADRDGENAHSNEGGHECRHRLSEETEPSTGGAAHERYRAM